MIDFHLDWHVLGQFFEPLRANGDLVWAPGHGEDITRVCLLKSLHDPYHPCLSAFGQVQPRVAGEISCEDSWDTVLDGDHEFSGDDVSKLGTPGRNVQSFLHDFSHSPLDRHNQFLLADDVVGRHHADKSSSSNRLSSSNVASLWLKEDLGLLLVLHVKHRSDGAQFVSFQLRQHMPSETRGRIFLSNKVSCEIARHESRIIHHISHKVDVATNSFDDEGVQCRLHLVDRFNPSWSVRDKFSYHWVVMNANLTPFLDACINANNAGLVFVLLRRDVSMEYSDRWEEVPQGIFSINS
mmetsp:Transcript_25475/g.84256  ORF Transcript_25475/g.84256 Transcript_25475/m.84256 type:complete len:296 (-) Transcript_25475:1267-2154(-)